MLVDNFFEAKIEVLSLYFQRPTVKRGTDCGMVHSADSPEVKVCFDLMPK